MGYMAMSDEEANVEEVSLSDPTTIQITLAHEPYGESASKKSVSHIGYNELIVDHLELLKNHESLQNVLIWYQNENNKLVDALEMKGGELLEMTAKFKDLWDRFQRVQSSEQSLRTKLNDLNKASHALEAIKCSLKPASSVTGIDMSFFSITMIQTC